MKIAVAELDTIGNDIDYKELKNLGDVDFYPDKITEENAEERLKDASVLVINKSRITDKILDHASNLRLICLFATGFDNANISLCKERGIKVANAVNYSSASVAQHTLSLYFYISEHLRFYDSFVKDGEYGRQEIFTSLARPYRELDGKVWGIVGMGNIGKRVARIAEAYGAKVIFFSPSGKSKVQDYERVEFQELLTRSDVISLHCPLSDSTNKLFNRDAFQKMKKTAYLINVARGPVVDEMDLYEALEHDEIAGAGLDVLCEEPVSKENPLLNIKNSSKLIITPHIAWASMEARVRCVQEVCENIRAFIRGENRNVVNF